MEPHFPDVEQPGLSDAEVQQRIAAGQTNQMHTSTSRSYWQIIRGNVFTLFNMIIVVAMVLVLMTGEWKDAVFGVVVIVNAVIGIFTEIKAKRTLDSLSILTASRPFVRRGGRTVQISADHIVLGDLLWVRSGDQLPADGTVVATWGLELDESMLTGESRTVVKKRGSTVLSGAIAVSGMALVRVTAVGASSYAARLTAKAKVFHRVHSDLEDGINTILRWLVAIVVPTGALLFWSQMHIAHRGPDWWKPAIVSSVAGVVGMIPEGLVLLTSLNFAVSALYLAHQHVLIQQMQSVETLARVNCVNLDKTGTLTDGGIVFDEFVPLDGSAQHAGSDRLDAHNLAALIATLDEKSPNATARALLTAFPPQRVAAHVHSLARVPFSSARKWSALLDADHIAWFCGAPEIVSAAALKEKPNTDASKNKGVAGVLSRAAKLAAQGHRVLLFVRGPHMTAQQFTATAHTGVPSDITSVALIVCSESIRPDAKRTLAYFRSQGVRCRIVSGDNPQTVAAIAKKVDLVGGGRAPRWCDARDLPHDPAGMASALNDIDVIGRVLPEQKKKIVQALHLTGKTVAMTGDGVNDALAIKEADFGIAMGNASAATKAVADAVIVDSKFSHLPSVVGQGRRVMANMERVSSLFLVKTCYSILIALGVILFALPYPYLPRHLTYISALTIGIPAFILSLPPNNTPYRRGFLQRVLVFAIPSGIAIAACTLIASTLWPRLAGWAVKIDDQDLMSLRVCCAILVFSLEIFVLARVSRPIRSWRGILVLVMAGLGIAGACIPQVRKFFEIVLPDDVLWRWLLLGLVLSILVFLALQRVSIVFVRALNRRFMRHPIRSR
jgi:cation-transporting ATPase E